MPFLLSPGNAVGAKLNAHRRAWDGSICDHPSEWSCGAEQYFRDDYCSRGHDRCFHLRTFAKTDTGMTIATTGGRWLFEDIPDALDDQVLLLWGSPFAEPRGIKEGRTSAVVYGAYRVKRVVPIDHGYNTVYRVEPYADAWVRVSKLGCRSPFHKSLGGPYLKQVDRHAVLRLFDQIADAAERANDRSWDDAEQDPQRFRAFHSRLEEWLDVAAAKAADTLARKPVAIPAARTVRSSGSPGRTPFAELESLVGTKARGAGTGSAKPAEPAAAEPAPVPAGEPPATSSVHELVEPAQAQWIEQTYGSETLHAIRTAALTKPLVILRGDPGVGKSHLAVRLLDDETRERTCIVPVSATWRGREDLLGYVNPVTGAFEDTPFTRFLAAAAAAWDAGDRRTRVVVFEEFNLSQPEHWLSDILVVSQFDHALDRRILLGGKSDGDAPTPPVVLSPAVRFVATINSDHTTRPLSPRVLDRSAIVNLSLEPRKALQLAGVELDDEQVRAIETLDGIIRRKGASFSVRSALSLHTCLSQREALKLDPWVAVDVILQQEVLTKVRLLAHDPVDDEIMQRLDEWSQEEGSRLSRCPVLIEEWKEMLDSGRDVVQA